MPIMPSLVFVDRLENPIDFCEGDVEVEKESHLIMASPTDTLRKITLQFLENSPLPNTIERSKTVEIMPFQEFYGGISKWNKLSDMEKIPKIIFLQRMKEIWNDQLLTDRYLSGTSAIQIVDYDLFYSYIGMMVAADNTMPFGA